MDDISNKRANFKVQIRRKRIGDRISIMRANLYQKNMVSANEDQFSDSKISALVQQTLSSKEKLIKNINSIMYASYNATQQNIHLFFALVEDFCYVLGNMEDMKQTRQLSQDKDLLFNDIITTLINISSFQVYEWPAVDYLFLIKHLLKKQRETNTMWLLANILYQRITPHTQQSLTQQLIKYQVIEFCQLRLQRKFQSEYDIDTFANFVCVFLTNSQHLSLEEFKRVLKILQNLCGLNNESIDLYILMSMVDHAPHLHQKNYELLHTGLIKEFRERYIKKKKTSVIVKFLEFVKAYIGREVEREFDMAKEVFRDEKVAKKNYERICLVILPNLQYLVENRSPQVNSMLMQTCCLLLEFYFPFIDLQHQDIFLTLAKRLNKSVISTLSKYSDKAIYWQLRLVRTLLGKLNQHKIQSDIIVKFIDENQSLEAFGNLLRDKRDNREVVEEAVEVLGMIVEGVGKELLVGKNEKNQLYLGIALQQLENILEAHLIEDQRVYDKIEKLIQLSQDKFGVENS